MDNKNIIIENNYSKQWVQNCLKIKQTYWKSNNYLQFNLKTSSMNLLVKYTYESIEIHEFQPLKSGIIYQIIRNEIQQ